MTEKDACYSQPAALKPMDEALQHLLSLASPITETETLATENTLGRILASEQTSNINVPGYDNSAMDGYAIRSADCNQNDATLTVNQRIPAGTIGSELEPNCAARIFTGAPIPASADAVVMQEECEVDGNQLSLQRRIKAGENIRPRGNDIAAGSSVLESGIRIRPQEMAQAASVGLATLPVYRQLKIATFTTGDEIINPGTQLKDGQIYNSNRYIISGLLQGMGCEVIDLGRVADDFSATKKALLNAATKADLILTTGGVSVGEEDHVKNAVAEIGELNLWRIRIKPGKPLAYGVIEGTPFFGLPGNPVSSFVTFLLLVRPYLRKMQGIEHPENIPQQVRAGFNWDRARKRREFARVKLNKDSSGNVQAELYPKQGSDVLSSMTWADGLAEIPEDQTIKIGQLIDYYPFSELLS